jgi:nucleotide-binding universal stress UspA family protein
MHHASDLVHDNVHSQILQGPVSATLVRTVEHRNVACVVMASHGRGGAAKMVAGSIAAGLIHAVDVPVIVIPRMACGLTHPASREQRRPSVAAA